MLNHDLGEPERYDEGYDGTSWYQYIHQGDDRAYPAAARQKTTNGIL